MQIKREMNIAHMFCILNRKIMMFSLAYDSSSGVVIYCDALPCNEWQNFFELLQSSLNDKLNIE